MALPLHLLISHGAIQKRHPPNSTSPAPLRKYPQRDPGPHCPFSPTPGLRGFPQGKKTSGRKLRHLFSSQWGRARAGHRVLPHLAVPCQNPPHSLPSSRLSTYNNPWTLGKGDTVPIPGQILRDHSSPSGQGWHETGGLTVEASAMKSLVVEGESELPVFSMLWGGIDGQLLHVEAES